MNPTRFLDALEKHNLSWAVQKRPVFTLGNDGNYIPIRDSLAVVRQDNGYPLSVVGLRYEEVQNNECADIFDGVLVKTGGEYVNGGTFGKGKKVFVQARLPDAIRIRGRDVAYKLLTYINSHDSSSQLLCGFVSTVIVCQNTFMMAMQEIARQVAIRHTSSIHARLESVQEILESQLVYFRNLEVKANWLADQRFNELQMDLAMKKVLGIKPDETEIPTRTKNTMDTIMGNFVSGRLIDPVVHGTAWAAYNAFTQFSNHQKIVRNANERGGESLVRLENVLVGNGVSFNDRALSVIESVL